jgi:transcriptional antiterminator
MNFNLPEIFCDIPNFPNYKVSTLGNVWSKKYNKLLKPSKNKSGYLVVGLSNDQSSITISIHRLVLNTFLFNESLLLDKDKEENKYLIKTCVDHINNNPSDNRLENLRYASKMENGQNSKVSKRNKTSGVKGVYFDKERGTYLANIVYKQRRIFLGRYETVEEAIVVRRIKARELFGAFCHSSEL